ncbi:MAG: hypothetical protein ACK5C0_13290 [Candidatus Kapaibacterium sp.]|jgi:hypothetical protein
MGIFGKKTEPKNQHAKSILLKKEYKFMYENFVFSSQHKLYLFLEENNGIIEALSFDFKVYKYGYPNDEVGLPSKIPGVESYGFSQVYNSEWIEELKINNRSHPQHNDKFYESYKHYVVRFKDVTLEVIANGFEITELTKIDLIELLNNEVENISNDG